ncbi:MAG: radical SAM protein [Candidatus Micrarchaeota archaeon]|nr:radical SAM protein [Candidatus Micrarchaeota archaeon]
MHIRSVREILEEKEGRRDYLSLRIDKTVPGGLRITKRVCNENCVFDYATGAKCHDDIVQNGDGEALSNEEFVGLVGKISKAAGKKVRVHIAGDGEPTLLNNELVSFIGMLKSCDAVHSIKLTTNGTMLCMGGTPMALRMKNAGLDSVNISLHSLLPQRFKEVTGIDALGTVLKGIDKAVESGLIVTLNCVIRPETITELDSFVTLSAEKGIKVKFFSLLSDDGNVQRRYDALVDSMMHELDSISEYSESYMHPYDGRIFSIGKAVIEVKDSRMNRCPNMGCGYRNACVEGCRYEARLSRIGMLQPCGVRMDNVIHMKGGSEDKDILYALASGGKL